MAFEKTVLDVDSMKQILNQYYDIMVEDVKKLNLGSANCFKIVCKTNSYFLKEFQSDFAKDDLLREAELVKYLADKGISTAKYIKTVNDAYFFEYKGHLCCLEEYIDGQTYGYDDFPNELLLELARMLGKIHNVLSEYALPVDMGKQWIDSFLVESEQHKYDKILNILEQDKYDKYYEVIKNDIIYKQQLLNKAKDFIGYFENITYKSTHGDYQGCQLICDDKHIKAVIDFSSARKLPAVWEVMRSYVQTSRYTQKNAVIDIEGFCKYVKAYMEYSPLTSNDIEAMPYVYLFQLVRSTYGYPQYLTTDSEDREGLLRFALWRTNMCREVERKAEVIVKRTRECNY